MLESIVTANDKVFSGGELKSGKDIIERNVLSQRQSLSELNHKFISKYLRRTSYLRGSYDYIVDKMPENFLYLGLIQKLLPKSKIIRVFRNHWDTAISLYKQRYVIVRFLILVFSANFETSIYFGMNILKKISFRCKYEVGFQIIPKPRKIYKFLKLIYMKKKEMNFALNTEYGSEGIHQKLKKKRLSHQIKFNDALMKQRKDFNKK